MKEQAANPIRSLLTTVLLLGLLTPSAMAEPVGQNLLTNPGFESGLSNGWNTTPLWSRGNENSTPTPYEGDYYLRPAMPIADVTIAQEIDLTTLGLDSHRLETGGYRAYLEGAIYRGDPNSTGIIWLDQYIGSNRQEMKAAQSESLGWSVKSGSVQLRPGTTKVVYKFEAVTDSLLFSNQAYLDSACLKIRENTIWSYGDYYTDTFYAADNHTTSGPFLLARLGEGEVNITRGRTWTTNGTVSTDGDDDGDTLGTVNIASGIWQSNGTVYTKLEGDMYIAITDNGTWNSTGDVVFNTTRYSEPTVDVINGQWNSSGKVSIGEEEGGDRWGKVQIGKDGVWNSTGEVRIAAGYHSVNGGTWNASTIYLGMREPTYYCSNKVAIRGGGLLTVSEDLFLGCHADSEAQLIVENSRFISDGVVHVGCAEGAASIEFTSGSSWTSNHQVRIGDACDSEGMVTLTDTVWNSNDEVHVGQASGSEGCLEICYYTEWSPAVNTIIGYNGQGSLSVYSHSIWNTQADDSVIIGLNGDGHVLLDSHGNWNAQGTTHISYDEFGYDAHGDVMVSNFCLLDMTGELLIGERGLLEMKFDGTVRLRGPWTNRGTIRVLREGLLSIEHSGSMKGMELTNGAVSVLGTDTLLRTNDATVGVYCKMSIDQGATVLVDSGDFFNVDGTLEMPNGDGTIRINNGTLKCGGHKVLLGGGTIEGSGQIFVGTRGLDLGVDGAITGTSPSKGFIVWGNVSGSGELTNVTLYGDLNVGNSPGSIEVGGLALSSSGSLTMELGGLIPGTEYDQILVSGMFALDGTLEVLWYNGFEASAGDTFTLFDVTASGSLDGQFDNILLPTFTDSSIHWDTSNLYTDGTISAVPEPMTWVLLLGLGAMAFVRRRIH